MDKTDQIKMENDTFALQRDYKRALENLSKTKLEAAEVIAVKEMVQKQIEEKQAELTQVLNDIAQEKNDWAQFRHSELKEIEGKKSEVQSVLNWKADLNKKEEEIRKIEAEDIEIRNEARRIEFKNEQDKTALEVKEREIEGKRAEIGLREEKVKKDIEDFKNKVLEVLERVKEIQ